MSMMMTLRGLAALLTYPSEELRAHVGEIRSAFAGEGALSRPDRRRLEPLLKRIAEEDVLDLQARYSELFDRGRALSLHLFEHVHGDGKERGQAMIDLAEQYAAIGIFLDAKELPDFIPVFLEYASCLPEAEGRETLSQPGHVFAALAERLDEKDSDFAPIFHALVALGKGEVTGEEIAELSTKGDEDAQNLEELDAEWEEAPISFEMSGAHAMGGPTGVVAKIRASNRKNDKETDR